MLIIDETTDISVSKMLIIYKKFKKFNDTVFVGIIKLVNYAKVLP